MRNLLTISVFLLIAVAGLSAQGNSNQEYTPSYRMEDGFQLRDLIHTLNLTREQTATLKDYFSATSDARRIELADAEGHHEESLIYIRYQSIRDAKIRTIISAEQLPKFEAFLLARNTAGNEQTDVEPAIGGGK